MLVYILKSLGVLAIIILVGCVISLYKVFYTIPDAGSDKGSVALGIIAEIVLIVLIAVKIVSG